MTNNVDPRKEGLKLEQYIYDMMNLYKSDNIINYREKDIKQHYGKYISGIDHMFKKDDTIVLIQDKYHKSKVSIQSTNHFIQSCNELAKKNTKKIIYKIMATRSGVTNVSTTALQKNNCEIISIDGRDDIIELANVVCDKIVELLKLTKKHHNEVNFVSTNNVNDEMRPIDQTIKNIFNYACNIKAHITNNDLQFDESLHKKLMLISNDLADIQNKLKINKKSTECDAYKNLTFDEIKNAININISQFDAAFSKINKTECEIASILKYVYSDIWKTKNITVGMFGNNLLKLQSMALLNDYTGYDDRYSTIDPTILSNDKFNEKMKYVKMLINELGFTDVNDKKILSKDEFENNIKSMMKCDFFNNIDVVKPLFQLNIDKFFVVKNKIVNKNNSKTGLFTKTDNKYKTTNKAILGFLNSLFGNWGFKIKLKQDKEHEYIDKKRITISINQYHIELLVI